MRQNLKNFSTRLILTLTFLTAFTLYSKAEDIRMVIKEERASCSGVGLQTCFLVKYKTSTDWEYFYSGISGFKYQPGYRYTLLVTRTRRTNVPADASIYQYKLKRIIRKQKIAQTSAAINFVFNHKWKLIQMNGITQEESPAYLVFHKEDQRFNGSAGCNNFFGGYELTSNSLTFKQAGSTMMACPEEAMKLEATFLNMISDKTFRYDLADQTLNLYQGNKLVLMFGMAPLESQQEKQ